MTEEILHRFTEIGMYGTMGTMSHSDFTCSIGLGLVETMPHHIVGARGHEIRFSSMIPV